MPLYLVEGPTVTAVSLADAKAYLRVEHNDEDVVIAALIAAAERNIDGRDGWLNRALVSQTWELRLAGFDRCEIPIPLPPLIELVSAQYYDADNVLQTLSADVYELAGVGGLGKARLVLKHGQRWPETYPRAEAALIRFRAGYVDTMQSPASGEVPAPIVAAIKRMVATLYDNRDETVGRQSGVKLPVAVEALLAPYRVW
jgi:uncharacterized phiE125 gp8 family phage protein